MIREPEPTEVMPTSRPPNAPTSSVGTGRTVIFSHREHLGPDGLAEKRAGQQLDFTWALVRDELEQRLKGSRGVAAVRDEVRAAVLAGELTAPVAADRILAAYDADERPGS